ncbi:hypothetical protein [Pragia fontium]|nr:hypothetical protein [Pragia fontium]VEJ56769.1 Uncharacterised protein [Pragia fontium]
MSLTSVGVGPTFPGGPPAGKPATTPTDNALALNNTQCWPEGQATECCL